MQIILDENISRARQTMKSARAKGEIVALQGRDLAFNRKMLELGGFDLLISPEKASEKKDKPKQLDVAFNHILAKAAAKNKISIAFDLGEIRALPIDQKSDRLMRISKIIEFCRKANTKITVINYRDKRNAAALLRSLGASSQQSSKAVA